MQKKSSNSVKIRYPAKKGNVILKLKKLVETIEKSYKIHFIGLFGSYASDSYSFGSDVDTLVVHSDQDLNFETILSIALDISLDLDWQFHVYSLQEMKKGLQNQNLFLRTILASCKVFYESKEFAKLLKEYSDEKKS